MRWVELAFLIALVAMAGCGAQHRGDTWSDEHPDPTLVLADADRVDAVRFALRVHAELQREGALLVVTAIRYLDPRRINNIAIVVGEDGRYRFAQVTNARLTQCFSTRPHELEPVDLAVLRGAIARLPAGEQVPDGEDLILVSWSGEGEWWTRRFRRSGPPVQVETLLEIVRAREIARAAMRQQALLPRFPIRESQG